MHFRKKRTLDKYHEYKKIQVKEVCSFCIDEPSDKKFSFKHWKILKNLFPYDLIAEHHDLLIPHRHFNDESEMTEEERAELTDIKTRQLGKLKIYDFILENFSHMKSVQHYHLHLVRTKGSSYGKNK